MIILSRTWTAELVCKHEPLVCSSEDAPQEMRHLLLNDLSCLQGALCHVEVGASTRGQSIFDFTAPEEQHNVSVVTEIDMQAVMKMLSEAVR